MANEDGIISRVISTDLTYSVDEALNAPWFIRADLSKYIAYLIATLNHDRSLHKLLNPQDRIQRLIENYKNEQAQSGLRLV